MAPVDFINVRKSFGAVPIIKGVNIEIADGEFVILVGPSGCGKSTLLRMLAGLENITAGEIRIGGRVVNRMPPKERDIAMVFQSYALFPHLTVAQNIAFGLEMLGKPAAEVKTRTAQMLALVKLDAMAGRKTSQLSGGQQQRVAIARALANDPPLIVADEPTGRLDSVTAEVIFRIFQQLVAQGKTLVMVTHDRTIAGRVSRMLTIQDGEVLNQPAA